MERSFRISPRSVGWALGLLVVLLTLCGLASAYGSVEIKRHFVMRVLFRLFYLNEEANLPAYFSSLQWLLAALLAGFVGSLERRRAAPYANHWIVLGLIFGFLSVDEAAAIHEAIGVFVENVHATSGYLSYGWVLYGIPFVIIFVVAYARFLIHLPTRIRNLFVLAGATYVFGALGMEMFAAAREKELGAMGYQIAVAVEEFSEMLGLVLLTYALLSHIESLAGRITIEVGVPRVPGRSLESPDADSTKRSRWLTFGLASAVAVIVAGGIVAPLLSALLLPPAVADRRTAEPEESARFDRVLAGELGPGDRRLAQDGSYVDVHELSLPGHSVVSIWMESTDFAPYLAVLGPDGTRVTHDPSPQSRRSRVEFVTSTEGRYRVLANAYRDGAGAYRLGLETRALGQPSQQPSAHPASESGAESSAQPK